VTRRLLPALVLLFALRANAFGQPTFEIVEAECFHDGTLVGATSDLRLFVLKKGGWQPSPLANGVGRLWRSPDDRVFAIALGGDPWSVVEVARGSGPSTRWAIPTDSGAMRFTSLNGVDVVTHDRVFRLDPGGTLSSLGETPIGGSGQPLHDRAPEILAAGAITVVCTGTSQRADDNVGGSCRQGRGAYLYRVDFGDPLCCESDAPYFTAPFICGNAVISAIRDGAPSHPRDRTQARALATGTLLGRTEAAARRGSACLDGKRALLVGKQDIRVVSVPDLRLLWRQTIARDIGAVAVCGGNKAFVVPKMGPDSVQAFDLH
jgi:hypothetical protein